MGASSQRPRPGSWIAAFVALVLIALPAAIALHDHSPALAGRTDAARGCSACAALHSVAVVETVSTAAAQLVEIGTAHGTLTLSRHAPDFACPSIRGPPAS